MSAWRMALRGTINPADGSRLDDPFEMWPACRALGVAAITYHPVQDADFANYDRYNRPPRWSELAPAQKQSMNRFVYEMAVDDVIYVKQGPQIAGKGIVIGGYQFDLVGEIQGGLGAQWRHQRRVRWQPDFTPLTIQLGAPQNVTIVRLVSSEVARVEQIQGL